MASKDINKKQYNCYFMYMNQIEKTSIAKIAINKFLKVETIEKIAVSIFILTLPLQIHHFFSSPLLGGKDVGYLHISLYLTDIITAFLLTWLIYRHLYIGKLSLKTPLIKALLAYFAIFLLTFTLSPRGGDWYSLFPFLKTLQWGLITWYFALVSRDIAYRKVILYSLSFSGLIQAVIGIGQYINQKSLGLRLLWESPIGAHVAGVSKTEIGNEILIRSYGLFYHPNQFGAFLIVSCAATLVILIHKKHQSDLIVYGTLYATLVVAMFFTFSRASLLGLFASTAITLFIYWLARRNAEAKEKTHLRNIVILCIIVLTTCSVLTFSLLKARSTLNDKSVTERIDFNSNGIEIAKSNLISGVGPGYSLQEIYKDRAERLDSWEMQPPHNYFILTAAEMGLVGLITVVVFFYLIVRSLVFNIKRGLRENINVSYATFLLSIFVAFLITMQFDHYFYNLQQTQLLFWMTTGLIVGLDQDNIKRATN
jgi:hypothetical protein